MYVCTHPAVDARAQHVGEPVGDAHCRESGLKRGCDLVLRPPGPAARLARLALRVLGRLALLGLVASSFGAI